MTTDMTPDLPPDMTNHTTTDMPAAVRAVFDTFAPPARAGLLRLRALILAQAAALPMVGPIEETLRWGQPAYLTTQTKSGSTLRLGVPKAGGFALYVHCQTSLIADFRMVAAGAFRFEGQRAVLFDHADEVQPDLLALLVRRALCWHVRKGST